MLLHYSFFQHWDMPYWVFVLDGAMVSISPCHPHMVCSVKIARSIPLPRVFLLLFLLGLYASLSGRRPLGIVWIDMQSSTHGPSCSVFAAPDILYFRPLWFARTILLHSASGSRLVLGCFKESSCISRNIIRGRAWAGLQHCHPLEQAAKSLPWGPARPQSKHCYRS